MANQDKNLNINFMWPNYSFFPQDQEEDLVSINTVFLIMEFSLFYKFHQFNEKKMPCKIYSFIKNDKNKTLREKYISNIKFTVTMNWPQWWPFWVRWWGRQTWRSWGWACLPSPCVQCRKRAESDSTWAKTQSLYRLCSVSESQYS